MLFSASAGAFAPAPYYEYDPAFNQDASLQDHFPSFSGGIINSIGYKVARLDNGDMVMAGIVDQIGAGEPANNVGLTRYGPNGQNIAWSNPDPGHTDFDTHYLVYPNDATSSYSKIDDVVVLGGNIYVLADCTCGGADSNVHILSFHDDGSFIGDTPAFHTAGVPEFGAALVPYFYPYFFPPSFSGTAYELVAFATYNNGSRYIVTAGRWNADEVSGALAIDSGFGPYGNGKNDYLAPASFCVAAANCTLIANGAAATRTTTSAPTIYVAATTQWQGTDEQMVLLQVDSAGNGQFLQTFGFDEAGGNLADQSVAIATVDGGSTSADAVYLAAQVGRAGGGIGVGVVKFLGGVLDSGFSGSGHVLLAGTGGDLDQAFAMTIDQGLLAVAGEHTGATTTAVVDPLLAVVRATDGALINLDSYPLLNSSGYRFGNARFSSVFGNGDGRFTAAGNIVGRYTSEANFGMQRFSHDRIFRDRFDGL